MGMTTRCWYCGEEMGYESEARDRDTCDNKDCVKAARLSWREDDDERAERAANDNYERY